MEVKAILFDKDGTLFDFNKTWGPWFFDILNELSQGSHKILNELSLLLDYDLKNKVFKFNSPFIAGTEGETVSKIVSFMPNLKKDKLVKWLSNKSKDVSGYPVLNLKKTLKELNEMNILMGIATNDNEIGAQNQLKESKIDHFFNYVYGSDSGFGFKPECGMQDEFLRVSKLHPKHVLMVGDSYADIISGKKAGMKTIGVLTGVLNRHQLEKQADVVLSSINELPNLIYKLNVNSL